MTKPDAQRLARRQPDLAARLYGTLAARILKATETKTYDATLSDFEETEQSCEAAGQGTKTPLVLNHVPVNVCSNCGEQYVDAQAANHLLKVAKKAAQAAV